MSLNFSKSTFLYFLSLSSVLSGCTQRQDLAPVITNLQLINPYDQDTPNQSRTSLKGQIKPEDITGTPIKSIRKVSDIQLYPKSIQPENVDKPARLHIVKKGETLFSIGVRTGIGYENLAIWNNIMPPYRIYSGQKIRLFNSNLSKKNAALNANPLKLADRLSTERSKNILVNSNSKLKGKANAPLPAPPKPQQKPDINIKKSIISIDNKNMLMLHFQWPIKGKIKKNFFQTNRKGIDIVGKISQTVRAAEAGKVVYCGQGIIGFGHTIVIKHNDTYLSAYANNRHLLVKEGDYVRRGQHIAKAGMSVSKKGMLHFEIRKKGKSVDPLTLLPKID